MEVESILQRINKAGLKFLGPLKLSETFQVIVDQSRQLLDADWALLHRIEKGSLVRLASSPKRPYVSFTPRKSGFTYKSYKKQKAFVIHREEIQKTHPELKQKKFGSAICIPLSDPKKSIYTLLIFFHKDKNFSQKDLELLSVFGSYATLAIRKAKLYEDIKNALKIRDLFISMAAHELRTPLTAVNGYVQLLYNKLKHSPDTSEARWSQQLLWESKRLTLLINELLEVDQIKTGQLQYRWQECDVDELIKRTANNFKFMYPKRILKIVGCTKNTDNKVIGDFDKLLQVLMNILDNAVKFSPKDTPIELSLTDTAQTIHLEIKDRGKGFDKNEIDKIFDGYYHNEQNQVQGMGIGLYLVKNILKLHKGTIVIDTAPGRGTTAQISLQKLRSN